MASERLMKFTGDLKALPFRDLMVFSRELAEQLRDNNSLSDQSVALALVNTAEKINPDVDVEVAPKGRTTLRDRIGG